MQGSLECTCLSKKAASSFTPSPPTKSFPTKNSLSQTFRKTPYKTSGL